MRSKLILKWVSLLVLGFILCGYYQYYYRSLNCTWSEVLRQRGTPALLAKKAGRESGSIRAIRIVLASAQPPSRQSSNDVAGLIAIWVSDDFSLRRIRTFYKQAQSGDLVSGWNRITSLPPWGESVTMIKFDERGVAIDQKTVNAQVFDLELEDWKPKKVKPGVCTGTPKSSQ